MTTPDQLKVSEVLEELKLERDESGPFIPGAPTKFMVTEKTLNFLRGKSVTVDASGAITFEK